MRSIKLASNTAVKELFFRISQTLDTPKIY